MATESVVLLHGLARTAAAMRVIEQHLQAAGYWTVSVDYPSRQKKIEVLAQEAVGKGISICRDKHPNATIHFVGHSLGGILVRYYLSQQSIDNMGKLVMIAPPNGGTKLADIANRLFLFRWMCGSPLKQLGTDGLPTKIGAVHYPTGIIAGRLPLSAFLIGGALIARPNDGTLPVESTKVEGMQDFITVPCSHSLIIYSKTTARQTVNFIRDGTFEHG